MEFRWKSTTVEAYQADELVEVLSPDGSWHEAMTGDWVIVLDGIPSIVLDAAEFTALFEPVAG